MQRGTIFRAVHDDTYENWQRDEPQWKFCVVFNVQSPSERDDVHYFFTTKNVEKYTEHPLLLSECLILAKGTYGCFPLETAIEFDQLQIVAFAKLRSKGLCVRGQLSPEHITLCEKRIGKARVLLPKHRKLLGL